VKDGTVTQIARAAVSGEVPATNQTEEVCPVTQLVHMLHWF